MMKAIRTAIMRRFHLVDQLEHERQLLDFGTFLLKHRDRTNIAPLTTTDLQRWRKFREA